MGKAIRFALGLYALIWVAFGLALGCLKFTPNAAPRGFVIGCVIAWLILLWNTVSILATSNPERG